MILALLASAVITFSIPAPPKVDPEELLDAIKQVEAWNGKTGKAGEWGPFAMIPSVWRHCRGTLRKTMQQATPAQLRAAAREELLFRIATLEINHVTITPYAAALAWGAGVRATLDHSASDVKRDYARRVAALYESVKQP